MATVMDALKAYARRTAQRLREAVVNSEATPQDEQLLMLTDKVHALSEHGELLYRKMARATRLLEELGVVLQDIGNEYGQVPDLAQGPRQLSEQLCVIGGKLSGMASEQRKQLRDGAGGDVLRFLRECAQLPDEESARRNAQLEYDFFKDKVEKLRQAPPEDFSRIPRNERVLEGWRVELWRATEANKSLCSRLYMHGRRTIDKAVAALATLFAHTIDAVATWSRAELSDALERLPSYPREPVLAPLPLPPNPQPSLYASATMYSSGSGVNSNDSDNSGNYHIVDNRATAVMCTVAAPHNGNGNGNSGSGSRSRSSSFHSSGNVDRSAHGGDALACAPVTATVTASMSNSEPPVETGEVAGAAAVVADADASVHDTDTTVARAPPPSSAPDSSPFAAAQPPPLDVDAR